MAELTAVTPDGKWAFWESANLRGSPATHGIIEGAGKTLCGRNADGWMWQRVFGDDAKIIINCKQCLAKLED